MTATWSVLAYVWLYVIVVANTTDLVEPWEALLTLLFFPLLTLWAWIADKRLLVYDMMNKTYEYERSLAKICMGIVTLFLVCHLIRVLDNLNIIMIWDTYVKCKENGRLPGIQVWQYHLTIFGFVFVVINSAINMPLFYILNVSREKKTPLRPIKL